jgi:DNA-binding transcriptional regulator YdaS (Cro superfamily)
MTPQDALREAIDVLGSQQGVAEAAGYNVKPGHIYHWLNGAKEVPAKYCPGIEAATREKGRPVFCEHLCPSAKWPAMRNQPGPVVKVVRSRARAGA